MSTAGDSSFSLKQAYDPDANVYAAGLPLDFNQSKLYNLFIGFGEILRFKFVASKDGSKCSYGFVQFERPQHARRAIQALNGHCVDRVNGRGGVGEGIQLSIAAVGRRTSPSEEPTNLYIENMPGSWNNEQLAHVFGPFGSIVQSKITGNNVAFVRFETHQQALNAINHLNKKMVDADGAKRLIVRFATCQHKKAPRTSTSPPVASAYAATTSNNGDGREHCFPPSQSPRLHLQPPPPPLSSPSSCSHLVPVPLSAVQPYLAYHNADGTGVSSSPKSTRSGSSGWAPSNANNLYIKNLPPNCNQEHLEKLFSAFGAISSATIINDSVGVAFVRFKHARDAKRAIDGLHGSMPPRFEHEIVVKYAHSDIDQQQPHLPQEVGQVVGGGVLRLSPLGPFSLNGDAAPFTPRFMAPVVGIAKEREKEDVHVDGARSVLLLVSGYVRPYLHWSNDKVSRTVLAFVSASQQQQQQQPPAVAAAAAVEIVVSSPSSSSSSDVQALFPRINSLDDGLHALQKNMKSMSASMSNVLFECEQKRVFESSAMQQTVDGLADNFYQQLHSQMRQMQSLTEMVQQQQLRHEQQMRSLQQEIAGLRLDKICMRSSSSLDHNSKASTSKTVPTPPSQGESEMDRVRAWVTDTVGLPLAYCDVLVCHGYDDLESIRDLTDHDLLHIGITKIGHRQKIIKHAQQISASSASSSSSIAHHFSSVDSPPVYYPFHHLNEDQLLSSLPLPLPSLNTEDGDVKPTDSGHGSLNLNFEVQITPNVAEMAGSSAAGTTMHNDAKSEIDYASFIDSIQWA